MPTPKLYLNHIANFDWLIALEFGRVDDSQAPENWRGISESFGYLHEEPEGREIGFKILDFSKFDPDAAEVAAIWDEPRFDAPVLGLRSATAGEIVLAARALFGRQSTINRHFFNAAIDAEGEEALGLWLSCLQAGDSMAHYGLGYTLYGLGRYPEAYRHLRHYTEIAPSGTWPWLWLGKAAAAIGETGEARSAYERALELAAEGGEKTDAAELLAELDSPPSLVSYEFRYLSPSGEWEYNGTGRGSAEDAEEAIASAYGLPPRAAIEAFEDLRRRGDPLPQGDYEYRPSDRSDDWAPLSFRGLGG